VKFPNLYARELWRRNWIMGPGLLVVGGALVIFNPRDKGLPILIAECVIGALLVLGFFGLFRRMSYVRPGEDGLLFNWSFPLKNTTIPYEQIRAARVAPLKNAFPPERKSYVNNITKPLLDKPAVFLRLGGDEANVARISKRLGKRYAFDSTIAVPVDDPESLAQEVSRRLPNRLQQQNLGGARRRKRRR